MNEEPRSILWTGGFDSTWLVVDALLDGYRVNAVTWRGYGMRPGWQKVDHEDEARRRIVWALPTDLRSRIVSRVEADSDVEDAMFPNWQEMAERMTTRWAGQNYLLASLPVVTGPVEVGFVADDRYHPTMLAIHRERGLSMPILDQTKRALLRDAQRRGFDGLLAVTWSCEGSEAHCGTCEPCQRRIVA